jgi:hypothetical protein
MEFMKKSWARGTQATVLAVLLGLPGAGALAAPPSPGALDRMTRIDDARGRAAAALHQAQMDQFRKGFGVCMEGKGYTAK